MSMGALEGEELATSATGVLDQISSLSKLHPELLVQRDVSSSIVQRRAPTSPQFSTARLCGPFSQSKDVAQTLQPLFLLYPVT